MLTIGEIQQHLRRLTYRPGWAITAYQGRFEGQHVTIQAAVDDSLQPGKVTLRIESALPPMRDTDQLEEWLVWRLARIETHEAREWLKRDGQTVFDPHAEYADRDL